MTLHMASFFFHLQSHLFPHLALFFTDATGSFSLHFFSSACASDTFIQVVDDTPSYVPFLVSCFLVPGSRTDIPSTTSLPPCASRCGRSSFLCISSFSLFVVPLDFWTSATSIALHKHQSKTWISSRVSIRRKVLQVVRSSTRDFQR